MEARPASLLRSSQTTGRVAGLVSRRRSCPWLFRREGFVRRVGKRSPGLKFVWGGAYQSHV